jgi:hypothetical protein
MCRERRGFHTYDKVWKASVAPEKENQRKRAQQAPVFPREGPGAQHLKPLDQLKNFLNVKVTPFTARRTHP